MNTDYNLYKIFLHLYEEKSISKTANKLYVSQPAISYSLKELEAQLGYSLFHRNSKGIEPTEEAKELYGYISTAFHILQDAENHIQNLSELKTGTIKIGTSFMGKPYIIQKIIKFQEKYPNIHFEIFSKSREEMIHLLEIKEIDLMIESLPLKENSKWEKKKIQKLDTCFVYHKRNYKHRIKSIQELENHRCFFPSKNNHMRKCLEDYLEKKNLSIDPILESDQEDLLLEWVRQGKGIGFFPKNYIQSQLDQEDFVILEEEQLPKIELGMIYIEEMLSFATKKLIKFWEEKE